MSRNGTNLVEALKELLECKNNARLADTLAINHMTVSHVHRENKLGKSRLRNFLKNFRAAAFNSSIRKVAEFYHVHPIKSAQGKKIEFLNDTLKNDLTLKKILKTKYGVYSFYDSAGQIIYVGKAKETRLFDEMKSAFNRKMNNNKAYLVRWPDRRQRKIDFSSSRKISAINRKLHAVARYFSAYEVAPQMIDPLEAFVIRMVPNNVINVRIEGQQMWPPR